MGARSASPRRRAWRALIEFHGALTTIFEGELRDATGLDLQTYDALLHTYEAGSAGIRMTDLAQRVILTKSGLTSVVDRLERRGYLRRIPDPSDRRATRVTLTARGEETFREAATVHLAGIKRHFADRITDEEARVIIDALARVRAQLSSGQ